MPYIACSGITTLDKNGRGKVTPSHRKVYYYNAQVVVRSSTSNKVQEELVQRFLCSMSSNPSKGRTSNCFCKLTDLSLLDCYKYKIYFHLCVPITANDPMVNIYHWFRRTKHHRDACIILKFQKWRYIYFQQRLQ